MNPVDTAFIPMFEQTSGVLVSVCWTHYWSHNIFLLDMVQNFMPLIYLAYKQVRAILCGHCLGFMFRKKKWVLIIKLKFFSFYLNFV